MEFDVYKKKIRRASAAAFAVLVIYLIYPVIMAALSFRQGWNEAAAEADPAPYTVTDFFIMVFLGAFVASVIVTFVTSIKLLMSMRKDESPFTLINGRRIRRTGICFMLMEPLMFMAELLEDGLAEAMYSIDGLQFATGLVMYCISLAFSYGAALQQEADETI